MTLPNLLTRALRFLQVGYVPNSEAVETVAVLAVLDRRLSEKDVARVAVAMTLRGAFPIPATEIRVYITKITGRLPQPDEVARVRNMLEICGWSTFDDCAQPDGQSR